MANIDPATGLFTEGRFKGYSADDIAAYAETLDEAVKAGQGAPPMKAAAPPPEEPDTPERRLAAANGQQTLNVTTSMIARMLTDDEEAFSATVPDYDKYKQQIMDVKKNLRPEQLMMRGLHRQLYINAKGHDPEVMELIMKHRKADEPEAVEEPEAEEKVVVREHERNKPQAKAVPPVAKPTATARQTEAKAAAKKSKLQATDKVLKFCRATGQDVDTYLSTLEAKGITQEQLTSMGVTAAPERRSVYDRTR